MGTLLILGGIDKIMTCVLVRSNIIRPEWAFSAQRRFSMPALMRAEYCVVMGLI